MHRTEYTEPFDTHYTTPGFEQEILRFRHNLQRLEGLGLWCLTPLSAIFQLYRGRQFYWWRKPEYQEKTINVLKAVNMW
jgi:hypothetical protein